jgi:hypothetical protein
MVLLSSSAQPEVPVTSTGEDHTASPCLSHSPQSAALKTQDNTAYSLYFCHILKNLSLKLFTYSNKKHIEKAMKTTEINSTNRVNMLF